MKFRFVLCFLLSFGCSTLVHSQIESSKKKLKLALKPRQNAPEQTKKTIPHKQAEPTIKYESQLLKKQEDPLMKALSNVPKIEVAEKKQFEVKNSSELYEQRLKKKEGEIQDRFKSDTFLGQFSSSTKTIRIACRDHEAPDGDLVRVWLNDQIAINQILLDVDFKEIYLELNEGINKIEFEALNQGESGPNTAQFVIVNAKGVVVTSNKWNLTTGVKAKVIVVKEDVLGE